MAGQARRGGIIVRDAAMLTKRDAVRGYCCKEGGPEVVQSAQKTRVHTAGACGSERKIGVGKPVVQVVGAAKGEDEAIVVGGEHRLRQGRDGVVRAPNRNRVRIVGANIVGAGTGADEETRVGQNKTDRGEIER